MTQSTFNTAEDARRAAADALSSSTGSGADGIKVSSVPSPDPNAEESARARVAEALREAKQAWGETAESDAA